MPLENYLTPNDPDAFKDWTKEEQPKWAAHLCPLCKGYGGWNLALNKYPKQQPPNNHFRCQCDNCNGYGYVQDNSHIHKFTFDTNLGRCYNQYKCTICGMIRKIDSGD